MSARTGDPRKTLVPKTIMAVSTNEVKLDDAGRNQISVRGVSGFAPLRCGGQGRAIAAKPASCYTYISIIYYVTCNYIPQVAGAFNKYLPVNSVQLI